MSADMGTRLLVVRHGETDWNAQRRVQGHTDIALNDTGKRQASLLARALEKWGARVAASNMN